MLTFKRVVLASLVCVWLLPAVLIAQAPSVKVREQEPNLLAQAKTQPDAAMALASAQMPGAKLIGAELERQRDRLVYLVDFRLPGKDGIRQVQIDASTGLVITVEHHVEVKQPGGLQYPAPTPPRVLPLQKFQQYPDHRPDRI